jgi:hypothetical protein
VLRKRRSVLRRSRVVRRSNLVRRNRVLRRRRLSLSVWRGRLGGAMWLLLLLHLHEKRIEF